MPNSNPSSIAEGFLRLPYIIAPRGPLPISRSSWWAGVKDGRFPKPVKLGPRITAWRVEDISLHGGAGEGAACDALVEWAVLEWPLLARSEHRLTLSATRLVHRVFSLSRRAAIARRSAASLPMYHRIQLGFRMPLIGVRPRMLTAWPIPVPPAPETNVCPLSHRRTRRARRAKH